MQWETHIYIYIHIQVLILSTELQKLLQNISFSLLNNCASANSIDTHYYILHVFHHFNFFSSNKSWKMTYKKPSANGWSSTIHAYTYTFEAVQLWKEITVKNLHLFLAT
jgi:hypothetical protein